MDRREFIKACSIMAVAGILFGCRKLPFVGETSSADPTIRQFQDEVRLAITKAKEGLDLVRVQAPGALSLPDASRDNRFGMAIDLDACDGCGKCILACSLENNVPLVTAEEAAKGRFMHWIDMHEAAPFMCAHCENAPCEKVCPTGAANHTPDGLSAMTYKRCAGSRFCGTNCPLQARKFNYNDSRKLGLSHQFNAEVPPREKGVMEKCSMCIHRLQEDRARYKTSSAAAAVVSGVPVEPWRGRGVKTACAESCPKNAIVFGNWLDEKSPLVEATRNRQLYAPRQLAKFGPSIVYMMGRR
ncbi:MAG: 4Fe-4S dicluster domain-containing protein [Fibrobacter sp.]|nr:4Fe-4S dicluster domain-containing protein [Fibrobacter sp.]